MFYRVKINTFKLQQKL